VLAAVADVAGAALEHAERREHTEETVRARVETLAAALELRDRDTGRHVAEVVELALEVGERLGLERPALVELEFAARLHDVGKIAVPDPILRKPEPLAAHEWDMMRRHPEWGSGMLAHIPGLEAVALVVRFHHERYDGTGYPDGLEGDCIPLASRIVAVCDAYEAIVTDR
jgi:HD-GYP domain-containing protein (c-di-GMP phosphodiesterase class II)